MKRLLITLLLSAGSLGVAAQAELSTVLSTIEENNLTLKAARESVTARKLENRTGISLPNPEAGFGYFWGNSSELKNRTDFSLTQSFDIATLGGMKSRVANEQNDLIDWQYRTERINILLEAKQYCLDLIYYNGLRRELLLRLDHAQTIAAGYTTRLERGDANRLEYNKAQLNLSTVQGELTRIEVERRALLSQLQRLNAGEEILLEEAQFPSVTLPPHFEEWCAQAEGKNPLISYASQEIELEKSRVTLSKAGALPSFSTGFMSEFVGGERYRGITFGLSIPLWENRHRVQQAKAAVRAAEWREADTRQQYNNELQIQYNRALGLRTTAQTFRQALETANNTELLGKALSAGEISLLEYMMEIGLYYETVNQALAAERDYQKAVTELSAVEL